MRIYARDTEVRQIGWMEAKPFLDNNHKQGSIKSEAYYGLYYNGELVQIEAFGLPRIEIQNKMIWHDWELLRECSKKGYYIIGGKSKLLKAFERDYKPLALLSYCNVTEGFDGHSYAACGFTLERTSEDYYYEYEGKLIKRYQMQKNKNLRERGLMEPIEKTLLSFNKKYDYNLTEKENAEIAGFKIIKGKGQQVWTKYYSDNIGYIYEITGPDGKTYIGQHALRNNSKLGKIDYFGSGVYLNRAVEKYGKRAFHIHTLEWTNDLNTLTDLEYKYIAEAKAIGKAEYNVSVNPYNAASHNYQNRTPNNSETLKKYYETHEGPSKGKHPSIETRIKMSESRTGKKHPRKPGQQEKIINSEGYKNRRPRAKDSYTDEWKAKVSKQSKLKMEEAKQKDTEYIHSLGYITTDDLIAKGWTYGQTRKLVPVGKYKRLKYFNKL